MTSTTTYPQPDHARLADSRRFRHSITALAGAAVLTGTALVTAPAAGAATADYANGGAMDLRNQFYMSYNNADMTILDASPASLYPSPVTISGVEGVITDVDIVLKEVDHTFPDDLDVMLVGPTGQKVIVMSDVGGSDDITDVTLTLDDEANASVPSSGPITGTHYKPTNDTDVPDAFPAPAPTVTGAGSMLSDFDGIDPNGTWQLFAMDDSGNDVGLITGWTLDLKTTDHTHPYPSTIGVAGAKGTVTDVDVALHGFDHTFPDDLDMMLVGPGGQRALIMSDAGGDEDVLGLELVIDDESGRAMPDGNAFTTGGYRPANFDADTDPFHAPAPSSAGIGTALSVFDGTDPNGTWQLFITDDASRDQGGLEGGWSLHISTTDAPLPAAPAPAPPSAPAADTSHPKVQGTAPKAGATGIKRGAVIKATLDEKARKATVTRSSVKLVRKGSSKAVPATIAYNGTTRTISIDPATTLRARTTYKVVVTTAVRDLAGNALDQKPGTSGLQQATWRFTTR